MDKLEYDSLHKFLVSLGLIFIAFPFVILYLFFNRDLTLMSQEEYDQLSTFSQNQISHNQQLMKCVTIILPIVCAVLLIAGIILLIIGIRNWKKVQKNLDAVIEADRIKQELDVSKMKSSEKLEQACEEICEAESTNTSIPQPPQSQMARIKKYLDIEDRYFSHILSNSFKRRYTLQRNLRIGRYEYDGIAISMTNNIDIIYEIKYWKYHSSTSMLIDILKHLYDAGINYESLKHRGFHCILAIITPNESMEKIRNFVNHILSENNKYALPSIEVQFIAEEDI